MTFPCFVPGVGASAHDSVPRILASCWAIAEATASVEFLVLGRLRFLLLPVVRIPLLLIYLLRARASARQLYRERSSEITR